MGNYVDTFAPKFGEQLAQQEPEFVGQIKAKIADLREDPYHNTKPMKGQTLRMKENGCPQNQADKQLWKMP